MAKEKLDMANEWWWSLKPAAQQAFENQITWNNPL